jgi:hypothetical protein
VNPQSRRRQRPEYSSLLLKTGTTTAYGEHRSSSLRSSCNVRATAGQIRALLKPLLKRG